jgi:hypothetical protein
LKPVSIHHFQSYNLCDSIWSQWSLSSEHFQLCHKTGNTNCPWNDKQVAEEAIDGHVGHGDILGFCADSCDDCYEFDQAACQCVFVCAPTPFPTPMPSTDEPTYEPTTPKPTEPIETPAPITAQPVTPKPVTPRPTSAVVPTPPPTDHHRLNRRLIKQLKA